MGEEDRNVPFHLVLFGLCSNSDEERHSSDLFYAFAFAFVLV